jgi:hypothetical protein
MSNPRAVTYRRLALVEPDEEKARLLHQLAEEAEQGILVTADWRRLPAPTPLPIRALIGLGDLRCPRKTLWTNGGNGRTMTHSTSARLSLMALPPDEWHDREKVNAAVRDRLRLGPVIPAGEADLYGVPKATE